MDESKAGRQVRFLPYRPLVPAVAAFASGIAAREFVAAPAASGWVVASAAAAAFAIAAWRGRRAVALSALYVLLAGAGWVRLDAAAGKLPPHHLAHFVGEEPTLVKVRGVIVGAPAVYTLPPLPLSGDSSWLARQVDRGRLDLAVREIEVRGRWLKACGTVHATVYDPPAELWSGDLLVVTGTMFRPRPATNPGEFDFARLYRRRGIHAAMSASGRSLRLERRGAGRGLMQLACVARARLRRVLQRSLARDERTRLLLCATLLGDRAQLDEDFEESFKRSGTMHLLAISGLHVGIVAWLVWHAAALAGLGRCSSGVVVLATVALYAMVTGLAPSVLRATVMTGALVLSIMGRRRLDLLQATALAGLVVLVARPFDLFHAGFQLSFAAVAAIVCVYGELRELLRPADRLEERVVWHEEFTAARRARWWLRRHATGAVAVSTAAWLGVLPLTAYYFHLFSPITVLGNLVAVPLLAVVVALGFVHLALAMVSPALAAAPGWLAQGATAALTAVVEGAARVPMAWTYCASPALGWVVAYYVLGLVVVARRRLGLSGRHAAMLWMAALAGYLLATLPERRAPALEVCALDVRHGSAAVLRYPDGSTVVCDCGSYGRTDVGRWVAAPALWRWGVRRIDLLVVSHADVDHINGIPALLERFAVGRAIYSPILERSEAGRQLLAMLDARGVPHEAARAGDRFVVGQGNPLDVLAPLRWTLAARPDDQNENSLVLGARHQGRRVLVTGDIQLAASAALLGSGADLRADVLIVPHHGCKMHNTPDFARAVRPAVAICSNRADHLPPATVAAYEQAGARVLATCSDGAVTVTLGRGPLSVATFRKHRPARRPDAAGSAPLH